MLAESPGTRYVMTTDVDADPEAVIVGLGIRDKGTCELQIPRAKYDGVRMLELIGKYEFRIEDA